MRGHIVKRFKSSYTIFLNLGVDPATGKRKQQIVSIKGTKKEAEQKLAELIRQIDTGTYTKPNKILLADFLKNWLADYKINLSPRGFERYKGIIEKDLIPAFGRLTLVQLHPEHIQSHYTANLEAGLSARTVRYHHAVLHVALKSAVRLGLLARNPADAAMPPRAKRPDMQTWDEDELNRFLESSKNSIYHNLFYTVLFTGMRRSELLGLRWSDVDFIMSQIYISRGLHQLKDNTYVYTEPKSEHSRRAIALSPSVINLLKRAKERRKLDCIDWGLPFSESDPVFCGHDGKPLRPNTVTRVWHEAAKRAGVKDIRLHDARHTHASIMLKRGIHPKIVQERLGHSSIQMTLDTYSHVAPGLQQKAAEAFETVVNPLVVS
jgi:integrase